MNAMTINHADIDQSIKTSDNKARRRKLFAGFAAATALLGSGYFTYDALVASKHVATDNAYVGAYSAEVTPLVGGPVAAVEVEDTQRVRQGQVLVRLDDTDARLALARAEAALGAAERKVRGLIANDQGLGAQVTAQTANRAKAAALVAAAQADVTRTKIDLDRRKALAADGSVSGEELSTAQNAHANAVAALKAAEAGQAEALAGRDAALGAQGANSALIAGTSIGDNPEVAAARAMRDQARVDLDRTVIRAKVDGIVTRRQVQVGQRVQPGASLMTIVPVERAYVDANFKEIQLAKVKPGQKAEIVSDLYGKKVVYHGTVTGFSGGTGAAFAIVPAQNATGNWIKVVQRLPVRIALDPKELRDHPLRVGLSMDVDIKVAD
ncbi:MAG: HlyD family efflux transporter periplasmic adaptor subunit [Sphingomonas taxi]